LFFGNLWTLALSLYKPFALWRRSLNSVILYMTNSIYTNPAIDPASPGRVRMLLQELGATPNRTLGQNFLVSPGLLDRIVATAQVVPTDAVLEIGPGLGALTCRLVAAAGSVTAVEKDAQFIGLLQRTLPAPNLRLVSGDALRVDWEELALPDTSCKVVANLPYIISKPMLRRLMEEWRLHFTSLTILLQREVADRVVALPGTSAYGPMAIMAALHGEARRAFDVKPGSFLPPPKVTSSVVHIAMRTTPSVAINDEAYFWKVVGAAFSQRRKQLGNTLKALALPPELLTAALSASGIDARRRGETLSLAEFAALSDLLGADLP
jgi:16S rRNA (adenine1518-N6/adenine1519-N6)-dimethyltransferase